VADKTVMYEYADVVEDLVAKCYRAWAIGRVRPDGMWEGCIEFVDLADDERLKTGIETMQSSERAFRYWPPASARSISRVPSGARGRARLTDQRGSSRRFRPCRGARFSIHLRSTRKVRASSLLN